MKVALKPANETERLDHLLRLELLDTIAEQSFDDVTRVASQICGTPIALISLVDQDRQWFKSKVGLDAEETPRDVAFCAHAILQPDVFVVEDALEDDRFHDNPLVVGQPIVRFYAGAPLLTDDGLGLGTLCVIDHEPRHLTDAQLASLEALGRQVLKQFELRLLLNEMRRVDELKNEFIATVNHELRTPLTSIRGALSLVNSGQVAPCPEGKVAELLEVAERNASCLLSLVNDLLDIQKIEAGKVDLVLETLDLADIVASVVELTAQFVAEQGCVVEWQPPDLEAPVQVDRARIVQVLSNLVSNAAKFSAEGSPIRIELRSEVETFRVSVIDRGRGIPRSAHARIFQKFSQVDSANHKYAKGTGLGLVISKDLVESHGGSIGFTSEEGCGSTFYFDLPRVVTPVVSG